jgi:hypothetical protein
VPEHQDKNTLLILVVVLAKQDMLEVSVEQVAVMHTSIIKAQLPVPAGPLQYLPVPLVVMDYLQFKDQDIMLL